MRPSWDDYFLKLAEHISTRGTCPRRYVGAVIVDQHHRIVSTGYNGAPAGVPQCDEVGCLMVDGHCKRSLHGDENAILHGGDRPLADCTMYIYGGTPCTDCAKLIHAVGIKTVVCRGTYPDNFALTFLQQRGVMVIQVP